MRSSPSPVGWRWLILFSLRGTRRVNGKQRSHVPPAACFSSPGAAEKVKKRVYGSKLSFYSHYIAQRALNPTESLVAVCFLLFLGIRGELGTRMDREERHWRQQGVSEQWCCGAPSKMLTTIPTGVWGCLRIQAAPPWCQSHGNGYVPAVNLIWATHRNRSSQIMLAVCPKPHQMWGIRCLLTLTAVRGFPDTEICHYNLVV